MPWLCDLGQDTPPLCAPVSASEREPTTTPPPTVSLRTRCRRTHAARGTQWVRNPRVWMLRAEGRSSPFPSLSGQTEAGRQDWEAKLNLSQGFPRSLLPSSGRLFFRVCLLEHTLPRSAPSAYELSRTSYLISPLKNWALKARVTHVDFHQRFRGLCALPLMLTLFN